MDKCLVAMQFIKTHLYIAVISQYNCGELFSIALNLCCTSSASDETEEVGHDSVPH